MKTLTVSIAAYNVEQYIENTLESLCRSDALADIEILVQTNAATDSSVALAKKYESLYPDSIRVLERPVNGGYGSTINDSISIATGKYFKTLDGDDRYETDNLVPFIETLKACEADLVISEFSTFIETTFKSKWSLPLEANKTYSTKDLKNVRMHSLAVRTALLQQNHVRITENCFYTDIEYSLKAFKYANTFQYIPLSIYCYRLGYNEQSVSVAGHLKHLADYEKIAKLIAEEFYHDPKFKGLRGPLQWKFLSHLRYISMKEPYEESKKHFIAYVTYLQKHSLHHGLHRYHKLTGLALLLAMRNPSRWFFLFRKMAKYLPA